MLIYNFQKEFIGIDEKDLKTLGFNTLAELRTEVTDFADLFVKTPGFIHNFKHVHWIDFITCADSNEESKVIININNKNFRCILHIASAYLIDNPSAKSYIVTLQNLRELTHKESESIAGDIITKETPQVMHEAQVILNTPEYSDDVVKETSPSEEEIITDSVAPVVDDYDLPLEVDLTQDDEELSLEDVQEDLSAPLEINFDDEDLLVDSVDTIEDVIQEPEEIQDIKAPATQIVQENFDNGYVYDPSVASEELGLPLDLIEEFIQDFITQAKEFKDDLYKAIDEGDLDNLKMLSHKLKGVAANLRIEDALEALTIANTSSDLNEISENLDTLYKIVAKLSGEEISVEKELPQEEVAIVTQEVIPEEPKLALDTEEDDLYSDPIEVLDSEVPDKIELPELADDTFLEIKDEIPEVEQEPLLEIEDEITLDETPEVDITVDYSKESVASEIGLDIESFNELFSDFTRESSALTNSISEAIEKEDFELCKSEVLKLKGMSENMRITAYSQELQTLMNSNDSTELSAGLNTVNAKLAQLTK